MSSKDNDEERVMHSENDNIEIMINNKADEVKEELFQSPFSIYQIGLEKSMKGSNYIFHCVYLLYHKCRKINFKRGGSSYTDFADWIKNNNKRTIKQQNSNKPHQ